MEQSSEVKSTEASMVTSSSSITQDVTSNSPPGYQDIDSEELEALEDEADNEDEDDQVINDLLDQAASMYPPETVKRMIEELKESGMVWFLHRYVAPNPGCIKKLLLALGVFLPKSLREADIPDQTLLPILKTALSRILRQRNKLAQYNTVEDALSLIEKSNNIIVLSGAGISVSCGIPDFRSKDGIYATLQREGKFELDDPQDMFDKEFFLHNPQCFYSFAHSIFPSNFVPSPSHRFIKHLENEGKLLRNYSQNIDTLERIAGINRVLQCHGSFATATCTDPKCGYKAKGSTIKDDIFAKRVPQCPTCADKKEKQLAKNKKRKLANGSTATWRGGDRNDDDDDQKEPSLAYGIMKPDITFFGEKLSDEFDQCLLQDREKVDLLIIMGTSLKVAPVSELVAHIPHKTPVILINKTPIYHIATDILLLGNADRIVEYFCHKFDWSLKPIEQEIDSLDTTTVTGSSQLVSFSSPQRFLDSRHIWMFQGAEPGRLSELWSQHDNNNTQPDADSDPQTDEDPSELN